MLANLRRKILILLQKGCHITKEIRYLFQELPLAPPSCITVGTHRLSSSLFPEKLSIIAVGKQIYPVAEKCVQDSEHKMASHIVDCTREANDIHYVWIKEKQLLYGSTVNCGTISHPSKYHVLPGVVINSNACHQSLGQLITLERLSENL